MQQRAQVARAWCWDALSDWPTSHPALPRPDAAMHVVLLQVIMDTILQLATIDQATKTPSMMQALSGANQQQMHSAGVAAVAYASVLPAYDTLRWSCSRMGLQVHAAGLLDCLVSTQLASLHLLMLCSPLQVCLQVTSFCHASWPAARHPRHQQRSCTATSPR